jgi:membrane protein DedA with SNARE-associated domain
MHFLDPWIAMYFEKLLDWGYPGIAAFMAAESTIVPIPSEVIIPPAAYWASQGKFSFAGVILAGTLGSVVGAAIMYLASRHFGRPLLMRYGRYVLLPPAKIEAAEVFVRRYHTGGVFFARLLPVVRHLIGIPAGLSRMPFGPYLLMTTLGSALWCTVLTWFGHVVLGDKPDLIHNPGLLKEALKEKSLLIAGAVLVLALAYVAVVRMTRKDAVVPAG